MASMTSSSFPSGDVRSLDQGATVAVDGVVFSSPKVISGASEVFGPLRILGEGYRLSCLYRCQDALDTYLRLPHRHYNTSWVLSQVGKAHFELVDYLEADRAFSLARRVSAYSLEGIDIYSTVLYHLKEDLKLSYLAQELISTDCLAPQSWCALGNCYSLQKDHETALKIFQRAVQLNSRFAYAHTLCGHEYVALEDFENGIKSYQNALRIDSRHYNACVYALMAKIYKWHNMHEKVMLHFGIALDLKPSATDVATIKAAIVKLHVPDKLEDNA
ncbi:hypothetical protein CRYUN_Cryun03dG0005600 [Craigia yunnanensis]